MAAIFQIRRGETNISIADGELYLHKGSGSIQFGSGSTPYNLLPLNAPAYGDINLSGSISASGDVRIGGNIYLGNATADNISALGQFTTNLVPTPHNGIDVGTTSAYWRNVYATNISGAIAATNGVISGSAQIAASLPQGVVSGSSQVIGILDSLNAFSGSQLTKDSALATYTGSVNTKLTEIGVVTGSLILSASAAAIANANQNTFTASANTSITNLNTTTASLNVSVTNLNTFSSSQLSKDATLATLTASYDGRFTTLGTYTASVEGRFSTLATLTGSNAVRLTNLETTSASVNTSIAELNSYTSSLKTAITASGTNVTINGNLTVKGTTTQIDSTTINIGDNIIELNYGGSQTTAGIYVKDGTGTSTTSGSLVWDSANGVDYWKAGKLGNESKILVAGGDNVISSSAQLTELNSFTASTNSRLNNLETTSASVNTSVSNLNTTTASLNISVSNLNTFSASENSKAATLATLTASYDGRFTTLGTYTASVEGRFSTLATLTGSNAIRLTNLESTTASLNTSVSNINTLTASALIRFTNLETTSASVNTKLTEIGVVTGSLILSASAAKTTNDTQNIRLSNLETTSASLLIETNNLELFSASILTQNIALATVTGSLIVSASQSYVSASLMTASVKKLREDVDYLYGIGGISGGNPLTPIQEWTASARIQLANLEAATSSYETKGRGIVSGSSQIVPLLPTGVISGSIQILGGSGIWSSSTQMPAGVVSGSSQVSYPSLSNIPSGIISGAAQLSGTTITNLTITNLTTVNQTSSIVFSSGSNRFGDFGNDTHDFTGSVKISGSITTIGTSTATSFNGIINATNGVISGSSQIALVLPAGVVSGSSQVIGILSSLNSYTASNDTTNTTQNSRLDQLSTASGSAITRLTALEVETTNLESFTSSINTTIKNRLNAETVISGSSQISGLSNAQLSNSSITIAGTSVSLGGSITAATILNGTNVISSSTQIVSVLPTGVVSGSSQIDLTATTNYASGILTRLNAVGVVSGSSQISLGSAAGNIALATQTTGDYVASLVQGTGVTITNNSGENATPTIAIGQAVGTSANVQFSSIGVGTTASGTSGEIRATGDITAYYSSDIRLKENIVPIPNALEKVNQISGNTYDWKEGYDEVHSHKGNDVGVIAQEIEAILPQIVTNRDTGFKAVQYEKIIPLLIEAIKELSSKVDRLENK